MLETARVLASGPPLKNPIVFLFNGAEEAIQLVRASYVLMCVRA
jgi:Zn-dependent M28 family amino/carboxypeptidase